MGSLKTIALAGAMAVGASAVGHAADFIPAPPPPQPALGLKGTITSGFYVRGDVGVGDLRVKKYDQSDVVGAGGTFFGQTDNYSVFAGAGIGYRFNNWFRVDGTFEYRGASSIGVNDRIDYINALGRPGIQTNTYKGNLTSLVTLFNAYIDLGTWKCLTPYIGGGIGYASNRISGLTDQGVNWVDPTGDFSSLIQPTLGTAGNGSKGNLAWALMAGIGYEVNERLTFEIGYRYLNLGEAKTGAISNAFIAQSYAPLRAKEIDSHDIRIGMRWNFGDPDCCTAKPVPYEPPPPVVRKY